MIARETEEGLTRLSVLHENTLPYSPYQNGKQESWWNQIEGRLLPMLEGVADLSLEALNEATLAWIEMEYNRKVHSETGQTPLRRYLEDKDVGRPSPGMEELQRAFTAEVTRTQRRSDGTISLAGIRFEIPSRYGHLEKLCLRFASWDLSCVYLCERKSGIILCRLYPLDKAKNAEGVRARRSNSGATTSGQREAPAPSSSGMAPLLEKIIRQYAITGLPPAYLPDPHPDATDHPQNPS